MTLPDRIPFIGWAWEDLLFLLFAAIMLGAALLVVLGRDIIRSGLWMILSFAALAGFYVLLGAPLVAAAQVLVYIGAISVLVLFAIMLTQSKAGPSNLVFQHQALPAGIAVAIITGVLALALTGTAWPGEQAARTDSPTDALALLLFTDYLLPFEIVSVLLLAAVIGGVFLAKRDDTAEQPTTSPIAPVDTATDRQRGAPPEMRQGEGYGG